jgi:uncharacterized OB-fold protein
MISTKPTPRISAFSRPFWQACNEERLVLQRCTAADCGKLIFYPRVCCPHCGGGELKWEQVSGRGSVTTFTIVQRPHHESFYAEAPFVFAAVALAEGAMIYTRIECDPAATDGLIGKPVTVVFRDLTEKQKVPFFAPT